MRRRALHAAAAAALLLGVLLAAGLAAAGASAARTVPAALAALAVALLAWRAAATAPMVQSIEIDSRGRFRVRRGALPEPCAPAWLNRAILVLDGAAFRAAIWRDSVDPTTWRRLNALARWHGRSAAGGGELPAPGAVTVAADIARDHHPGQAR